MSLFTRFRNYMLAAAVAFATLPVASADAADELYIMTGPMPATQPMPAVGEVITVTY